VFWVYATLFPEIESERGESEVGVPAGPAPTPWAGDDDLGVISRPIEAFTCTHH
jgi:hypothetical protein